MKKAFLFVIFIVIVAGFKLQAQCGVTATTSAKPTSVGIVIYSNDTETVWNAFRFAVSAKKQEHEIKLFLMDEAIECEGWLIKSLINQVQAILRIAFIYYSHVDHTCAGVSFPGHYLAPSLFLYDHIHIILNKFGIIFSFVRVCIPSLVPGIV
jgi:hypothetical protein